MDAEERWREIWSQRPLTPFGTVNTAKKTEEDSMSFICQQCGKQQPRRAGSYKKAVEIRTRLYANEGRRPSAGQEIVREITICGICAGIEKAPPPDVDAQVLGIDLPEPPFDGSGIRFVDQRDFNTEYEHAGPLVLDGVIVPEEEP